MMDHRLGALPAEASDELRNALTRLCGVLIEYSLNMARSDSLDVLAGCELCCGICEFENSTQVAVDEEVRGLELGKRELLDQLVTAVSIPAALSRRSSTRESARSSLPDGSCVTSTRSKLKRRSTSATGATSRKRGWIATIRSSCLNSARVRVPLL